MLVACLTTLTCFSPSALAGSLVGFDMAFQPSVIGDLATSRLTFTIDNPQSIPVDELEFETVLPSGMTVAAVPGVQTNCIQADVFAGAGEQTIRVEQGRLVANGTCDVSVNVVASETGTPTATLFSSAGSAGASATLTVEPERVTIRAAFSPNEISAGADSALTITFDNTDNVDAVVSLSLSGLLPDGLLLSRQNPVVSDCGDPIIPPTINAPPGGRAYNFFANGFGAFVALPADAVCTLVMQVDATRAGTFEVVTGELSATGATNGSSGFATAVLRAPARPFTRVFTPRQVAPGGTVDAVYSLANLSRTSSAGEIAFIDDVALAVDGAVLSAVELGDACGLDAAVTGVGSGSLSFSNGALAPEAECSFVASYVVPDTALSGGTFTVTSSPVTYLSDGQPRTWDAATDILSVVAAPRLEKSNSGPVGAGGEVTLTYVVTNTSTETISDLTFDDPVPIALPGVSETFPAAGFCGASSSMVSAFLDADARAYRLQGAELGPLASCSFVVVVTLPPSAGEPGGVEVLSSNITGVLASGATVVGASASDRLQIVTGPRLAKAFGGSGAPGSLLEVTYTLALDALEDGDAVGITFSDSFAAVLPGLLVESAASSDACGAGSAVTVNAEQTGIELVGGTLSPGETCSFTAQLSVPSGAAPGRYASPTSDVLATTSGVATTSAAASATLVVDGVLLSMAFTESPTFPGAETPLEFTIENTTTQAASDGFFTMNLSDALPGMVASALPVEPCGAGSSVSGTNFVIATGLSLPPLGSCTFEITVVVPSGPNGIGQHFATASGSFTLETTGNALLPPAAAPFVVADPLLFSMAFPQGAARPGQTAGLEMSISNAGSEATDAAFSLDLEAALADLAAANLPLSDVCGPGSTLSVENGEVVFAAPTLAGQSTCTFTVDLAVPENALAGAYTLVSSDLTASIGGIAVSAPAASAVLDVFDVSLLAAFAAPTVAGGSALLNVSIDSADATSELDLAIDVAALLPGAVAIGLPIENVCGTGALTGTTTVTLRGAATDGENACVFSVEVLIPDEAVPGAYSLAYGPLTQGGTVVAQAQEPAVLRVEPPPQLAATVAPSVFSAGAATNLTLTVDNTASVLAAANIEMAVTLPAGVFVGGVAASTCDGGTLTAVAGETTITIEGAGVDAAESCVFDIPLDGVAGEYVLDAVTLTSSNGASTSDPVDLTIEDAVFVSLAIADAAVFVGATTTVTATFENPSAERDATDVAISFALADVAAAVPLGETNDCGGALTPAVGAIELVGATLPAGGSCSLSFDVTGEGIVAAATIVAENGSSSLGPIAEAEATVGVEGVPTMVAAFTPDAIALAESSDFTLTLTGADTMDATGIDVSVVVPSELTVESIAPLTAGCGEGEVTQSGATLTLTAESLAAAATCTVSVTLQPSDVGVFTVTTSALSTDAGEGAAAEATLTVTEDGPEPEPSPSVEPEGEPEPEPGQTPEADPPAEGCGCTASDAHAQSSPWGILAVLFAGVLLRRRRQRQSSR